VLDGSGPFAAPVYRAAHVTTELAREPWQMAAYFALRQAIFVREQALFAASDCDAADLHATPIVALSHMAGMPDDVIGVVRIYETEPDVWYGGRLGVSAAYRARAAVGRELVRKAVGTANARGCQRFLATIQRSNVPYFERLHFSSLFELSVCGTAHHLMQADLHRYPAIPAQSGERHAA